MSVLRYSGGLSSQEGRRQRKQLERELEQDRKRELARRLQALKDKLKSARRKRAGAVKEARAQCAEDRLLLRQRIAERRARALRELREAAAAERAAQRGTCTRTQAEAAARHEAAILEAERELKGEKQWADYLRGSDKRAKARERARAGTAKERREEDDDAIASHLEAHDLAHYVPVFRASSRHFKGSRNASRLEQVLEWIESGQAEEGLAAYLKRESDRQVRDYERQMQALQKEYERRLKTGNWEGWEHGGAPERGDAYEDDLPAYAGEVAGVPF